VHSVPIRHTVEEQQPVKMTRRVANPDSEDILQANEFARELADASLPKYLKDLYVNFNFPAEPAHNLKDKKMTKANTIRSYENLANGKLTTNNYIVEGLKHTCIASICKNVQLRL